MANENIARKSPHTLHLLLIVLCVFLIYSNTLVSPFVFDDYSNIVRNPAIRDLPGFWPPSGTRYISYLSFALNYRMGGLDPVGYHLFNMITHALNGALVYSLVVQTGRSPLLGRPGPGPGADPSRVALYAALLFAAHPTATEAVSYVTQRFTALSAFFYLLSLSLYARWRLSGRLSAYIVSLAAALVAQMTKEISFTLPFVILLYEAVFFRGAGAWRLKRLAPFFLVLSVIPLMLFVPEKGSGISEELRAAQLLELETLSRHDYLATQSRVVVEYLRLLVLPVAQNLDYDWPVSRSFLDPGVAASFLFLLSIFSSAVFFLARSARRGDGTMALASFGVVWFFVTVSIESSVIPIKDVIFEHRLYLPSMGPAVAFSVMAFGLAGRLRLSARKAFPALLAVPFALGYIAHSRNGLWADSIALWKDTARKSPAKARPHINLGLAYREAGLMDDALREYAAALELEPGNAVLLNNAGVALLMLGRTAEAVESLRESVRLKPDYPDAHNSLGYAYYSIGGTDEAIAEFSEALRLKPGYIEAQRNLERAMKERR